MDLANKVVVITRACSSLGRAAALEPARRRSVPVLAAPRSEAPRETVELCRTRGARAVAQRTDVRREDEVAAPAEVALQQSGSLDVWVNDAAVTCFASLDGERFAEHGELSDANLCGASYSARAALPLFRRQRQGTFGLTETLRAAVAELPDALSVLLFAARRFTQLQHAGARVRALRGARAPA